jgi:hypothetical protein
LCVGFEEKIYWFYQGNRQGQAGLGCRVKDFRGLTNRSKIMAVYYGIITTQLQYLSFLYTISALVYKNKAKPH